jgi:hypothetical protein
MSEKPTNPGNARDLRQLLEAVLDALTLDYGVEDYDQRLKERAGIAKVVVRDGLDEPDRIGWNADWLRGKLRAEEAEAAERAARASVDRAFPAVAAFLATERGEGQ